MHRTYRDICATERGMLDVCPGYSSARACTAVAWAAVTGDDMPTAAYVLYEVNGKPPGSISWDCYLLTFATMGYTLTPVQFESKTTRTLEREFADKRGSYIVEVSGGRHALAIVNGNVVDWSQGRLHRVSRVWEVTK